MWYLFFFAVAVSGLFSKERKKERKKWKRHFHLTFYSVCVCFLLCNTEHKQTVCYVGSIQLCFLSQKKEKFLRLLVSIFGRTQCGLQEVMFCFLLTPHSISLSSLPLSLSFHVGFVADICTEKKEEAFVVDSMFLRLCFFSFARSVLHFDPIYDVIVWKSHFSKKCPVTLLLIQFR